MRYRKELLTTIGTIGCAVGIGFVMQQSQSAGTIYGSDMKQLTGSGGAVLDVEDITLTSGNLARGITPPVQESTVTPAVMPALPAAPDDGVEQVETVTGGNCEITANARPVAAAMVNLTLDASCLPNERMTVLHSGLLFNDMTDDAGQIDVIMPALSANATFVIAFSNGEGAVAQAIIEDISDYDRVAVQWKGETGFELHAREFGAQYGAAGHVWSGHARDRSYAVTGEGGYLSRLGSDDVADGLIAEVYTFPSGTARDGGEIDLSVEAQVADFNCGQEIEAETLQTRPGGDIISKTVSLSVPACDAAGNFLVLNNLFEDLKVAAN